MVEIPVTEELIEECLGSAWYSTPGHSEDWFVYSNKKISRPSVAEQIDLTENGSDRFKDYLVLDLGGQFSDYTVTMRTDLSNKTGCISLYISYGEYTMKIVDDLRLQDAYYVLYDFNRDGIKDFVLYSIYDNSIKIYDLTQINEHLQVAPLQSIELYSVADRSHQRASNIELTSDSNKITIDVSNGMVKWSSQLMQEKKLSPTIITSLKTSFSKVD